MTAQDKNGLSQGIIILVLAVVAEVGAVLLMLWAILVFNSPFGGLYLLGAALGVAFLWSVLYQWKRRAHENG